MVIPMHHRARERAYVYEDESSLITTRILREAKSWEELRPIMEFMEKADRLWAAETHEKLRVIEVKQYSDGQYYAKVTRTDGMLGGGWIWWGQLYKAFTPLPGILQALAPKTGQEYWEYK